MHITSLIQAGPKLCRDYILCHGSDTGWAVVHPKFWGVGSSLKLGGRRVGCYGERRSQRGSWGQCPRLGSGGKLLWSWWHFSTEHTFLLWSGTCIDSRSDRSDQTGVHLIPLLFGAYTNCNTVCWLHVGHIRHRAANKPIRLSHLAANRLKWTLARCAEVNLYHESPV